MHEKTPPFNPLIAMFEQATRKAFSCYPELYDRDVSEHICSHILSEFVRTDRLYWIRDKEGKRLGEIPDMLAEGDVLLRAESMEKELAVQEHIGNFSLFMSGLFPRDSGRLTNRIPLNMRKDRIYLALYMTLHSTDKGIDYYIIQGRKAYEKASRIYKGLNDLKASLLKRLSQRFESYVCLMQTINDYLVTPGLVAGT
ncbi:MAG: hypothetical protein ACMUIL_04310 [bacterium]